MIKNVFTGTKIDKLIFVIAGGRCGGHMLFDILNGVDCVNLKFEFDRESNKLKNEQLLNSIINFLNNKNQISMIDRVGRNKINYKITGCKIPSFVIMYEKYLILEQKNILNS